MNYNILPYASIEVLMQLTYYCRLYEASPYNMQIDRATFIALSFVKPKGLKGASGPLSGWWRPGGSEGKMIPGRDAERRRRDAFRATDGRGVHYVSST